MVVTGGPDGAIPQSPAVRRRNGFAEACSVRCGAGASPATPTACEPRSGGSAASSATPPTNPPTSSTSTASATACRTRATGRRRSPRSDKLDPGRVVLGGTSACRRSARAGWRRRARASVGVLVTVMAATTGSSLPTSDAGEERTRCVCWQFLAREPSRGDPPRPYCGDIQAVSPATVAQRRREE